CYRGEGHRVCSEGFYKSIIEEEIHSAPERSIEEKKAMISILQRMEDPNAFPDDNGVVSDDDEENELGSKLESLDLESADTAALWDALSPAQKDAFTKAMQDPSSALARQLLETTLDTKVDPWWEVVVDEDSKHTAPRGSLVRPLPVPTGLLDAATRSWNEEGPVLLYNILAVCLAYVFCIRTFGMVSMTTGDKNDKQECRNTLARAVPLLIDRKSVTRLDSVDKAIQYVQSRMDENLVNILGDVENLMRPTGIVEVPPASSLSSLIGTSVAPSKICLVLADIADLYDHSHPPNVPGSIEETKSASGSSRDRSIVQKLVFYSAHVQTASKGRLSSIADELYLRSSFVEPSQQSEPISDVIVIKP
ncbi:hypothetical protein FRC16_007487, partial [Serendipita sp. 398]